MKEPSASNNPVANKEKMPLHKPHLEGWPRSGPGEPASARVWSRETHWVSHTLDASRIPRVAREGGVGSLRGKVVDRHPGQAGRELSRGCRRRSVDRVPRRVVRAGRRSLDVIGKAGGVNEVADEVYLCSRRQIRQCDLDRGRPTRVSPTQLAAPFRNRLRPETLLMIQPLRPSISTSPHRGFALSLIPHHPGIPRRQFASLAYIF